MTRNESFQRLKQHHADLSAKSDLRGLFSIDLERFRKLSYKIDGGMLVDFSKNFITQETFNLLIDEAEKQGVLELRDRMFAGGKINVTEDRAVEHSRLRDATHPKTLKAIEKMGLFADSVRHGRTRGCSGKEFTDIVNIGIGGSSLGPEAVTTALRGYHHLGLRAHYVSNVEASDLHHCLQTLSPETTLFLVASKTFSTAETMRNASIAKEKLLNYFNSNQDAISKHFVALTANPEKAQQFGIDKDNIFAFDESVGGRYSVWSSVGLSCMLMVGPDYFRAFLNGAHEMDVHFQEATPSENIPLLMGLLGVWRRNICGYNAYACIPYHAALRRLPAWLQQLDMESNGKQANHPTGPIIFGEPGTDAQHSFFQWLHQGTDVVPVDFIAAVRTTYGDMDQQQTLLSNCLAQSTALMQGQAAEEGKPYTYFPGNRPSTTILLDELSPRHLGMLMALYEHKVFVEGAFWGINSFDQWGVELGKKIALKIYAQIKDDNKNDPLDAPVLGLAEYIRKKIT